MPKTDMPLLRGLRGARVRAALTKVELAKRSGVHRVTLARLESGQGPPEPGTVRKLADALGVEPPVLYGDEG